MPAGSLIADLLTAWNTINQKDEVGHYLDWATPTFWDTLTASLEELMAFKITPEEFTMKLETDYSAYLTSLK
jgi:raffinose/stachyose/melibiose transport system substrate-binding protein